LVVDKNKKVYVYSPTGTLLGSWTAGSLANNATVEGITVWGNDVWIVDARQDRVYRYANAAGRLSGSQNAASSFPLDVNNTSPKDLVTDGTFIWVVNDSWQDRVFKYTLGGTPDGYWGIDAANGSPTGITLDPSNPQHLWVVDSGTDRVYRYDYGVGRIGIAYQVAASASYALAAGNTNPQGIADPPPAALAEPLPVAAVAAAAWLAPDAARPDRPADLPAERADAAFPPAGAIEPPVQRVVEPTRLAASFLPPEPDDEHGGWWDVPLDVAG
jgi:hypothetical protein